MLGIVSFLMIVSLGWFTYQNYERERDLMENNLLQDAEFIKTSLRAKLLMGIGGNLHQLQEYVDNIKAAHFVKNILIYDENGNKLISDEDYKITEQFENKKIEKDSEDNYVFTLRTVIKVHYDIISGERLDNSNEEIKYITVLKLYANDYYEAQIEDVRRAMGTGLLLLVLALASVFFIFVIRRYYSVNVNLQNVRDYISNVVQSMPSGLISLDKTGKIETINRIAGKLLDLNEKDVVGKIIHEVLPNCKLDLLTRNSDKNFEQNIECHLNNGNLIPLNIIASRVNDEDGNGIGTVLIFTDLRELKSLEKAVERSEKLASMGKMAAGIAHEIRNPLSSIKGLAQYLRNKFEENSESREYATVMINEVDRLNRIIQDMLNFAKPNAPILTSENIKEVILHSLKLVESELNSKEITIVHVDDGEEKIALADKDLLTQVFLNLFINSIDAMDKNGTLQISLSEENRYIIVELIDNGGGIKEENIPKIFDPFFTLKQNGNGLGLAIVYNIIENHNGEITVSSKLNKGTTIKIKLPTGS